MKYELNQAIHALNQAQDAISNVVKDVESSKEVFKLAELSNCVDAFCKKTNSSKADICLLADIGKSTLTAALKNPEKATMTTILAIGAVIGLDILLGRHNAS